MKEWFPAEDIVSLSNNGPQDGRSELVIDLT